MCWVHWFGLGFCLCVVVRCSLSVGRHFFCSMRGSDVCSLFAVAHSCLSSVVLSGLPLMFFRCAIEILSISLALEEHRRLARTFLSVSMSRLVSSRPWLFIIFVWVCHSSAVASGLSPVAVIWVLPFVSSVLVVLPCLCSLCRVYFSSMLLVVLHSLCSLCRLDISSLLVFVHSCHSSVVVSGLSLVDEIEVGPVVRSC